MFTVCRVFHSILTQKLTTRYLTISNVLRTGFSVQYQFSCEVKLLHQSTGASFAEEVGLPISSSNIEFLDHEQDFLENLKSDSASETQVKEYATEELPLQSDTLAAYVNISKVLQTLVLFGVQLHRIEKDNPAAMSFLVKLDLMKDITPKLQYLTKVGVMPGEFSQIITKNPFLLDPSKTIEDIKEVTEYLESKNFTKDQILILMVRFPQMWNMSIAKLDGMLGFYQNLPTNYETKTIRFSGPELRNLILKCPAILALPTESAYLMIKSLEMSCGFSISQIRQIVAAKPSMLFRGRTYLGNIYQFCSIEMGLTHDEMSRCPFIFDTRLERLVTRHRYLKLRWKGFV
uniref:Uncharacterized protein n=1 Tax=Ciona savignyi TaxID=51511 RepID=H2ZNS2_CIOSA